MHTLYYGKGTAALAVHIALEEVGATYDTRAIDMKAGEQRSGAFLEVNPKGRVPALVTPDGILTETPAILGYIARTWPDAGLMPETPFEAARVEEFASYLASTVHVAHAHKLRQARWSDDEGTHASMAAKVPANMDECASMIERHYLAGPWVLGERYSIADPYLFTLARWLEPDGVDLAGHPGISDHMERMRARPAVARVMPLHE